MTGPIKRALELAKSGKCQTIQQVCDRLQAEGYPAAPETKPTVIGRFRTMIEDVRRRLGS
jgi:hypothetical protein